MVANFSSDVTRNVTSPSIFSADVQRNVNYSAAFSVDISRTLSNSANYQADVWRRMRAVTDGLKSLSITLASKTISDTFGMETVVPKNVGVQLGGTFLDFPWNFWVESTSQTEDVQTIAGLYDVEETLNTLVEFSLTDVMAYTILDALGDKLGKDITKKFDNFRPTLDVTAYKMTYRDVIANLFGWTSGLPQRQINIFLRGNELGTTEICAIQRGLESATVIITQDENTQYKFTRPTVAKKIVRTLLAMKEENDALSYVVEPIPFTGTVGFGDQVAVYEFGYLVSETHGTITTNYDYAGGYMSKKTANTEDGGEIITEYDYGGYSLDELAVETETTRDSGGKVSSIRVTRHVAAGKGEWVTTVTVDNELISSARSQGRPGGKASIYSERDANRRLGGSYPATDPNNKKLPGRAIIDTNWPVKSTDTVTINALVDATIWLNGKTEERVSMDIYGTHVIDFRDTVLYGPTFETANAYHLEKNVLSHNPRSKKQSIEIVRWY